MSEQDRLAPAGRRWPVGARGDIVFPAVLAGFAVGLLLVGLPLLNVLGRIGARVLNNDGGGWYLLWIPLLISAVLIAVPWTRRLGSGFVLGLALGLAAFTVLWHWVFSSFS